MSSKRRRTRRRSASPSGGSAGQCRYRPAQRRSSKSCGRRAFMSCPQTSYFATRTVADWVPPGSRSVSPERWAWRGSTQKAGAYARIPSGTRSTPCYGTPAIPMRRSGRRWAGPTRGRRPVTRTGRLSTCATRRRSSTAFGAETRSLGVLSTGPSFKYGLGELTIQFTSNRKSSHRLDFIGPAETARFKDSNDKITISCSAAGGNIKGIAAILILAPSRSGHRRAADPLQSNAKGKSANHFVSDP
jgi:hypothetical protein